MTLQEFYSQQESGFDSFCKTLIRNESINAHKEYAHRAKRECSLSSLRSHEWNELSQCDDDLTLSDRFVAQGQTVYVSDESLSNALRFLPPIHRDVILLSYFLDLSDVEIGHLLKTDPRTIGYRRAAALKKLRDALEAQKP